MTARWAVVVVGVLLGSHLPIAAAAEGDQKAIQGTWIVASAARRSEDKSDLVGSKMIFAGDKVSVIMKGADKNPEGTFKLDPSKDPKQLEITGKGMDMAMLAIYLLDGNNLKICMNEKAGGKRPTKFESMTGDELLIVLKREKP